MGEENLDLAGLAVLAASDDVVAVERAHAAAVVCMGREPGARLVAAMAYDRGRALVGREQKFGTQSVLSSGQPMLWPVDAGTTDSERAKWGVAKIAQLRAKVHEAPLVGKAPLRKLLRERRSMITAEQIADWAEAIGDHGERALDSDVCSDVVALYWPLPGEADPRPLARRLVLRSGSQLALPVVVGDTMTFRAWSEDAPMQPAGFGTFGPVSDAPEVKPTVVLTPLLGFDGVGGRLGQGRGYYDRKLVKSEDDKDPIVVGIASSLQELPVVPTDPHDRRLDMLLTEVGMTSFAC
jgi:5-formyltetrahydrofolate cyclo-ligase